MRRVVSYDLHGTVMIEVAGELDVVTGHDLRHHFEVALTGSAEAINVDLSRVAAADSDGITALLYCSDRAVARERTLTWLHVGRRTDQPGSMLLPA